MQLMLWLVLLVSLVGLAVGLINALRLEHIMSEQDDLAAGVAAELQADADIMAELSTISGELTAEAGKLASALAAGDATAIKAAAEAAAQTLTTNAAKVEAAVAAAKAADPTAPAGNVTIPTPTPTLVASPITVNVLGVPITATVGTAFTGAVTASGGSGPLTYAIDLGALPAGLSMAAGGAISGTPSAAGTFTADVAVTDGNGDKGNGTIAITVA